MVFMLAVFAMHIFLRVAAQGCCLVRHMTRAAWREFHRARDNIVPTGNLPAGAFLLPREDMPRKVIPRELPRGMSRPEGFPAGVSREIPTEILPPVGIPVAVSHGNTGPPTGSPVVPVGGGKFPW